MQQQRPARVGEYQVPNDTKPDTCELCGVPIMWIRTAWGQVPLSVATIEQDAGGRRFATSHYLDCQRPLSEARQAGEA